VLGLVVTTYIFYCLDAGSNQSIGPDQMQCLRSVIVQNDTLAFAAVCKGLHKHMLHSSTALQNLINAFVTVRFPS
jgi:dsRNA-specific ribonuclease